ncbi:hypothetical protein [Hymenobacter glacieicola]|uniref:Uncharacterized protein n=1 Tax=Hymenobacter glacieicola TaxID=1562124 RepID=A0ABQ1WLX3_9BACT|nr:hypothetical protein [Hymenobacter glacieicola]GGG35838.1 hypothetical protein GCM10011378_10130 [Hymenobacter glacieicola]
MNQQPHPAPSGQYPATPAEALLPLASPPAAATPVAKRDKLLVSAATRLVPLVELLDRIKPHVGHNTVFSTRRHKIDAQIALAYEHLRADQPKRQALTEAFKTLSEFVLEETREVSKDEVKESAKRFVLATLKNAPNLISAAKQSGLLS